MSAQRYIRLKETAPNIDVTKSRPNEYLKITDGSLGEGPWRVRTDEHGFILTGNDVPQDVPTMVFLGDSFVESTFAPEDARFVAQVERALMAAGAPYRCLNGGYSGATTLQLFNVFMNKIVPIAGRGGRVVFFTPQSDLSIYFRPHSYWFPTDRFSPVLPPFEPAAADIPKGSGALTSILGLLVWAAREFDIELVLVTSPYRSASRADDPYLERITSDEQHRSISQRREDIRAAVRSFAASSGVAFIDAATEFLDKPQAFYDELHLNDAGQDQFSAWLSKELLKALAT